MFTFDVSSFIFLFQPVYLPVEFIFYLLMIALNLRQGFFLFMKGICNCFELVLEVPEIRFCFGGFVQGFPQLISIFILVLPELYGKSSVFFLDFIQLPQRLFELFFQIMNISEQGSIVVVGSGQLLVLVAELLLEVPALHIFCCQLFLQITLLATTGS
jgi:hypothetical protein